MERILLPLLAFAAGHLIFIGAAVSLAMFN
jgi:hypothetical protein